MLLVNELVKIGRGVSVLTNFVVTDVATVEDVVTFFLTTVMGVIVLVDDVDGFEIVDFDVVGVIVGPILFRPENSKNIFFIFTAFFSENMFLLVL